MTVAARRTASNELHALSIAEASDLMRRKALSPVELTQALLDRAALLDPKINAYLLATPDLALQQARQAEREIMAGNLAGQCTVFPTVPRMSSPRPVSRRQDIRRPTPILYRRPTPRR